MPFSNLIGNDPARSALLRMAAQNSVPSTLLFCGPDGVGKSLFALGLAELLMGAKHAPKLHSNNHPDLFTYHPEGKAAIHTMENTCKLIDEAALPPFEAPVKVFIIHEADRMLPHSSNALLKTLEEPLPHCYFILLTSFPEAILPTIASRSRKVPFFPISSSQIESFLLENWNTKPEEARRIAFLSHGSLSTAKQLTQNAAPAWRNLLLEILSLDLPREYPQLQKLTLELEESCAAASPEEEEEATTPSPPNSSDAILAEILAWQRDLHLLKEQIAPEYLYHLGSIDRLKLALSKPLVPLEIVLEQISKSRLALQRSVRLRTVLEHLLLSI